MRHCIQLASKAGGHASPNPMVGSVLVGNDRILAEGYHHAAGEWHAERNALMGFDGNPENTTLYVNLEPCCHHGKTPPCTDIIIEKKIPRVVVAMVDPFDRVAGKGIETLRKAGIEVVVGVEEGLAQELNRFFCLSIKENRPWVTLKAATTLDGRIASAFDESKWITGEKARLEGRVMRADHDAILVGIGTVLADDPQLNARGVPNAKDPKPIILDSTLRCPLKAAVFSSGQKPLIFCAMETPVIETFPADIIAVNRLEQGLSIEEILANLHSQNIRSLLVEGGGIVHSQFINSGFVDAIELFMAPTVLGGGRSWLQSLNYRLAEAPRYEVFDVKPCGNDFQVSLRRGEYV